ncbi:YdeI/OmpD-associated family protein [Microbacterium sp. B2969]|uniref:YdeI/OmpD-associated family protein n=1 Tax=Microbacterium alkaliflavum TaxID=3248839 RepID=A0ABW7Q1Q2_9MICO
MRYETTMLATGNNTGIPVPDEVIEALGDGKRPAVTVMVNGYQYRSTVGVMRGQSLIPFSSDKRAATGIKGGDALTVDVELDTAPRTVEVPDDLGEALAAAGLREAFDKLPPSHRKAHVTSVETAKAADTRARRVDAVVAKLSA